MWSIPEYFDRKGDASLFWTIIIIVPPDDFFLMFLIELVSADRGKVDCEFAGINPTALGATQVTKRANWKTSHILCLLGIDRCGAPRCTPIKSGPRKSFEMWCTCINLVVINSEHKCQRTRWITRRAGIIYGADCTHTERDGRTTGGRGGHGRSRASEGRRCSLLSFVKSRFVCYPCLLILSSSTIPSASRLYLHVSMYLNASLSRM